MNPRLACLACLERTPPALFEAGLWIAAEHDAKVDPAQVMREVRDLQREVSNDLPLLALNELAQPLLRKLCSLGFQEDEYHPLRPQAALLDHLLRRRRGQPLALALLSLELARGVVDSAGGGEFSWAFPLARAGGGSSARSLWRAASVSGGLPGIARAPVRAAGGVDGGASEDSQCAGDDPAPVTQPEAVAFDTWRRYRGVEGCRAGDGAGSAAGQ